MKVALLTRRRIDQKWLAFLALLGENLLAFALVAGVFTRLFLMRPQFVEATLLPGLGLGAAFSALASAYLARVQGRNSPRTLPCALPVGPNRWFLILLCTSLWLPAFREISPVVATGISPARLTWEIACTWTCFFGIAQIFMALAVGRVRWLLEPAAVSGLLAGLAIVGAMACPLPLMMENAHIAIPVLGVLLLRALTWLPLPFGLASPVAALGVGVGLALVTGDSAPEMHARVGLELTWVGTFGWDYLINAPTLPNWFWAGLVLAVQSAFLDVTLLERSSQAGDGYDKSRVLAVLGLVNLASGLMGCCLPSAILLGHSVYKRLGGGSVYLQANGLLLLILSLAGLLPLVLSWFPQAAWAPLWVWILLSVAASESESFPRQSALASICAALPLFATFAWLAGQGWMGGSEPDPSLLTRRSLVQPWLHALGVTSLAQGAVLTGLLWGGIVAQAQSAIASHSHAEAARQAILGLDRASRLAFAACLLALVGIIHAPGLGLNLGPLPATYLMIALVCHWGYVVEMERLVGIAPKASAPPPLPDEAESGDSSENPDTQP